MKKKILAATLLTVACGAGCALGLSACGGGSGGGNGGGGSEKTLSGLAIFDNGDNDKGQYYNLGEFYYNTDVRLNSQFKLYAKFSDNTKEEINKNDGELTVSYSYGGSDIASLPSVYDLGRYSVTYTCNGYEGPVYSATVSFEIVPSATSSPYQLTLNGSMNFKYLEEPDLSVKKGDDTVSEYDVWYVTEADYNQIKNASAAEFGDLLNEKREYYSRSGLKPGTYYLYAKPNSGGCSNSTFQKVTVQKADVVPSVTTGFNGSYNYMSGGAVGKIKLSELSINRPEDLTLTASTDSNTEVRGEFKWVDGEEDVDCADSGETRSIKFVPDGDYAQCFNERIFYNIPVTIGKCFVYVPYLDGAEWNYWDGENHEIKLDLNSYSLDYFKAHVKVMHALSEVEVGDDLVLGSKNEIGTYRYTFELKDKVNYYWQNYQDLDDKTDVANKYFDYEIIARSSYIDLYNHNGHYKIDENLQVKIQIKPGNQSDGCNASPYKAGTLQAVILETYEPDAVNKYVTTVDADLEIVNKDGYDWIVITVKEFNPERVYGNLILKLTAEGDDHYADIDKLFTSLEIYRYDNEGITCPITSGSTVEAPIGTTVSELYAAEEYAGLETKLGKWVLYKYVGVVEDNYMSDISDSSWTKLEDTDELPEGEIRCKLTYVSGFVDDVYDIPEVALTLKGI